MRTEERKGYSTPRLLFSVSGPVKTLVSASVGQEIKKLSEPAHSALFNELIDIPEAQKLFLDGASFSAYGTNQWNSSFMTGLFMRKPGEYYGDAYIVLCISEDEELAIKIFSSI